MAGSSVTQTLTRLGTNLNSAMVLEFDWVADDADGTVPTSATDSIVNYQIAGWFITKVITQPGTPLPTTQYGITLVDQYGLDLAGGNLAGRSSTLPEQVTFVNQVDNSGFTFTLADNSATSAEGKCLVFLNR